MVKMRRSADGDVVLSWTSSGERAFLRALFVARNKNRSAHQAIAPARIRGAWVVLGKWLRKAARISGSSPNRFFNTAVQFGARIAISRAADRFIGMAVFARAVEKELRGGCAPLRAPARDDRITGRAFRSPPRMRH
jgi:hypothetical protein